MSTIFWDDCSPSDVGAQRVPILVWNLAPSSKVFVRFLGPYRGVWLHWAERSVPCRGDGCPFCCQGKGTFWMGYAPALLWSAGWTPIVCPLTYDVACQLRGQELAGLVVELERVGRTRRSRIVCTVMERPVKDPLPPPFDVEPILRRMWRLRGPAVDRGGVEGGAPPILLPFQPPAAELPPAELG